MNTCTDAFVQLSRGMDVGDCAQISPIGYLDSPLRLQHPTMAVIEALLITGAIAYVIAAVRCAVAARDPELLILMGASMVYMFAQELPAYFPDVLGISDLAFVHNRFSAGILFDRMPLYIIALYLSLVPLSFMIVKRAGIFARRGGVLLGAVCVGFIHHAFYEVFDHFGPQYLWWRWNYAADFQHLVLGSVPLVSLVGFSLSGPFMLTLGVKLIALRGLRRPALATTARTILAGLLSVAVLFPMIGIIGALSTWSATGGPQLLADVIAYGFVAVFGAITVWVLSGSLTKVPWRSLEGVYSLIYLGVFVGLWIYALPAYLDAENGHTAAGTPIGSLPYVVGCYAFLAYMIWRCFTRERSASVARDFRGHDGRDPATKVTA